MAILPKLIYKFSSILVRTTDGFFVKTENLIQKFIWNGKESQVAKTILKKQNKVGRLTLSSKRIAKQQ